MKLSKASKNGSKKPHNISQERVTKDNRCGLEEEVVDKLFGGGNNPEKNDIGAEKPRRVKFTAREVNELFNMLRVDPFVGGACGAYGQYPTPCHAKDFKWFDSSKVKDMKFNCYMCVDAGHLYDDLGGV